MGKRLIQQARGKGGPRYKAPVHKYKGKAKYPKLTKNVNKGVVFDLIKCRGHSAPLMIVKYEDGNELLNIAPEGIKVGQDVLIGDSSKLNPGDVMSLSSIPSGTEVFNLELTPGDGGKLCRASGTAAIVLAKRGNQVQVELPSRKKVLINSQCRATIGLVSGSGRKEKPFMKAGTKFRYMRARNKLWPVVAGSAMNASDHPFGNKRSSRKSKSRPAPRDAPPGRKVGALSAKRTGRKKR